MTQLNAFQDSVLTLPYLEWDTYHTTGHMLLLMLYQTTLGVCLLLSTSRSVGSDTQKQIVVMLALHVTAIDIMLFLP